MNGANGTVHEMLSADPNLLWERALDLACGDHAMAGRLLEMIVRTNRTTLDSLRESCETASWEEVGSAAHRIAGSARMLERDDLLAMLTQLEAAACKRDVTQASAVIPRVIEALAKLETLIGTALGNNH